jgi:hypothetical protein
MSKAMAPPDDAREIVTEAFGACFTTFDSDSSTIR